MSSRSLRTTRLRKPKQMPDFDYGENSEAVPRASTRVKNMPLKRKLLPERNGNQAKKPMPVKSSEPVLKRARSKTANSLNTTESSLPSPSTSKGSEQKRSPRLQKKIPIEQRLALEDARKGRPKKRVRVSMKSLTSLDVVTLDTLVTIPGTMLVDLFSELVSDEIMRQFTCKCLLMHTRCKQTFKSFGNETKARLNMQRHLQHHIHKLVDDSKDPSKATKIKFTAETIQARERRLMALAGASVTSVDVVNTIEDDTAPADLSASDDEEWKPIQAESDSDVDVDSSLVKSSERKSVDKVSAKKRRSRLNVTLKSDESRQKADDKTQDDSSTSAKIVSKKKRIRNKQSTVKLLKIAPAPAPEVPENHAELQAADDTEEVIKKNAEKIEELNAQIKLKKLQNSDHSYAQLFNGKMYVRPPPYYQADDDEDELLKLAPGKLAYTLKNKACWYPKHEPSGRGAAVQHDLACHYGIMGARLKTGFVLAHGDINIPIMQLVQVPRRQDSAPAVGEEVTIEQPKPRGSRHAERNMYRSKGCIVEGSSDEETIVTTQSHRPYPPMPKYQPEMGTKLVIPEEEMALGLSGGEEDDEVDDKTMTDAERERKLAIKCMRELKSLKGRRFASVVCKICQKPFTATATLMYHYRSHANIKPFICLLCNATFTRQHSLNYHMLIHNGQSRFRCPDCGRAFRHPSHYKEHRRRHTGETPFGCTDCPRRFKTRNTFKRHMATAHKKSIPKMKRDVPFEYIQDDEEEGMLKEVLVPKTQPKKTTKPENTKVKVVTETKKPATSSTQNIAVSVGLSTHYNIASGLIAKMAKQSAEDKLGEAGNEVNIEDDDDVDETSLLCLESQTL